jgi:hypothetical protein
VMTGRFRRAGSASESAFMETASGLPAAIKPRWYPGERLLDLGVHGRRREADRAPTRRDGSWVGLEQSLVRDGQRVCDVSESELYF